MELRNFFYIATPYSHPEAEIRQMRYELVRDLIIDLMKVGIVGYSPIVHSHYVASEVDLPTTYEYWHHHNCVMIAASVGVMVYQIHGWEQSKGVKAEVEYARSIGRPIIHIAIPSLKV